MSRLRTTQPALQAELSQLLNRHCAENASNTPDFLLAGFLIGCLELWNKTNKSRERWYGKSLLINGDAGGSVTKFNARNYK